MSERTLIVVKPDGVQRGLAGEIISRFERKGFKLAGSKFMRVSEELARKHYQVHEGKYFYDRLVRYICSGPVLAMVWEAEGIIAMSRKMMGATFGYDAEPGTIRGDYSCSKGNNLVHGSDSVESAEFEIGLWFDEGELVSWEPANEHWLRGEKD
ncbi:Nucleoside diphosphate kinase [Anaerohalosphaera lusitana]|uniref:Nucleoside diphosphate kinase n=1 Tax=Anaerohalosphaera lusitana TaxID=1936003 RepID=A0A1U9NHT1_9BACT|nr:nucleoside-diphosphate kinase [Anaerohalosphaera lusitana]AQT67481.1 Nucleoside diphosphate kinase [Anaerohalosphaera lusitana]